jgi:hypothetical protein
MRLNVVDHVSLSLYQNCHIQENLQGKKQGNDLRHYISIFLLF